MTPDARNEPPSLSTLFWTFTRIGVTSFGGGLSGWLMREFVRRRRWITEDDFLSGLALAQAFPGVNVVNLSIWIGYRLRGGPGALFAALGMVVPAMVIAIILASIFARVSQSDTLHLALAGIAAAAIGLSLDMGLIAARRAVNGLVPVIALAVTFVAIFVLNFSLIWVVLCVAPCSIAIAYYRLSRKAK